MFDVRWLLIVLMIASDALYCEGNEKNPLLIPDSEAVHTVGCLTDMFELLDAE